MSLADWPDEKILAQEAQHPDGYAAEIVRLRAELRGIGELQCSCADRDALAGQVAALHAAAAPILRWAGEYNDNDNFAATLASSADAAKEHDTRLRDIEHSETREVCMSVIEGRTGYEPMASALAERDAKARKAVLEEAAAVAKSYGPSRPIHPASNASNPNIRGRWEGEQAASGAIASLILALKEPK